MKTCPNCGCRFEEAPVLIDEHGRRVTIVMSLQPGFGGPGSLKVDSVRPTSSAKRPIMPPKKA